MSNFNQSSMAKIAINKSLLKEYNTTDSPRTVYMSSGDEFQIQLFNPEQFRVGAEISINGQVLTGLIVLEPGQRIWLERYTNKTVKFRFDTYEVESNNSEVEHAIANNGNIVVRFYKECTHQPVYIKSYDWNTYKDWDKLYATVNTVNTDNTYTCAKSIDCNFTGHTEPTVTCNATTCDAATAYKSATPCSATIASSAINSTINHIDTELSFNANDLNNFFEEKSIVNNTVETGRINEGSKSSQKFREVNVDFETWAYHTENIKILPASRKPITSEDLHKMYCTECGRKLNTKFKFCPYCGAKCV